MTNRHERGKYHTEKSRTTEAEKGAISRMTHEALSLQLSHSGFAFSNQDGKTKSHSDNLNTDKTTNPNQSQFKLPALELYDPKQINPVRNDPKLTEMQITHQNRAAINLQRTPHQTTTFRGLRS